MKFTTDEIRKQIADNQLPGRQICLSLCDQVDELAALAQPPHPKDLAHLLMRENISLKFQLSRVNDLLSEAAQRIDNDSLRDTLRDRIKEAMDRNREMGNG